jgi:hypothetical protein
MKESFIFFSWSSPCCEACTYPPKLKRGHSSFLARILSSRASFPAIADLPPSGIDPSVDLSLQGILEKAMVPEPGSLLVLTGSFLCLAAKRRRKQPRNN